MTVTAVFGGTFDPVHFGHLKSARALAEALGAVVSFVPCAVPAHRPQPEASAEHRLAMLKLATEDVDNILVDDCELRRDGTSFTIDTLKLYRERLGSSASLVFVMGFDAWLTLSTWKDWQVLADVAHLLVLVRPGHQGVAGSVLRDWADTRQVDDVAELKGRPAGSICHLMLDQVDVSATEIRNRLNDGQSVDELIPEAVNRYITAHDLYAKSAVASEI